MARRSALSCNRSFSKRRGSAETNGFQRPDRSLSFCPNTIMIQHWLCLAAQPPCATAPPGFPILFSSTTTRADPHGPAQPDAHERARARPREGSSHGYCHCPERLHLPDASVSASPRNIRVKEKIDILKAINCN